MLDPIADNIAWSILDKSGKSNKCESNVKQVTAHSTPLTKKKRKDITPQKVHKEKISKTHFVDTLDINEESIDPQSLVPCGTIWHQNSSMLMMLLSVLYILYGLGIKNITVEYLKI